MSKDNSNPFAYNVDTNYVPPVADDVVPAVPDRAVPAVFPAAADVQPAVVHTAAAEPAPVALAFTETTASSTFVSGKLSQPEPAQTVQSQPEVPETTRLFQQTPSTSSAPPPAPVDEKNYAFYNVRKYRRYFNVDTKDVAWRVGNSLIGPFHANFMEKTWEQPDLYGPFWVATTLIFVTAVAGNFANYIEWKKESTDSPPDSGGAAFDRQWYNDYAKLGWSALLFYGYVFVIGLVLYFAARYFKAGMQLVNVWCIYGYSLSIFIPISFACIPSIQWLRWTVIMVATGLSGFFLFMNFRATIYAAAPAKASLILLTMVGVHVGLGLVLKLFFFDY